MTSLSERPRIVCQVCGVEYGSSIISHIIAVHKMSTSQYRASYPGCPVQVMSADQRTKMEKTWKSKKRIKKLLDNRSFPSEINHWTNKGFTKKEAIEKVSEHQTNLALRQNNPETKLRQSENNTGKKNPMSLQSIGTRHGVDLKSARKLTPCFGRTGASHPMYGKTHTLQAREQIAKNCSNHFSQRSSAEKSISEKLEMLGYSILRNKGISIYNCDLVFEDLQLIVEYFGDFWHCNPAKWSPDRINPRTKMSAQDRWNLDEKKINHLRTLGYQVKVVWESEWKSHPDVVIQEIVNAANSVS